MSLNERDHIQPTLLEDEMRRSYLDYSMSVIVSRALPDVRDGLKPVHRRILFAMNELGMAPNKAYKKSARIVGEVLGKYHPHGDSSVYEAMVRMAQTWSLRYPLVQGQGNFGSVDGDSAAAMRYTEARLSWLAVETLRDIEKSTVDFRPNFDESLKEPTVLPTVLPTLLVNGASGIAVGMATNIPPHNLTEIVGGLRALIQHPDINTQELMEFIKAPDFPTAGIIYGYSGVRDAYETGRGKIIVRAKAMIETAKNGRETIIVNELPYQVSKAGLIEKIVDLVRNKIIEDISDIRDESDRDGMRIVIELKRDAQGQVTLNNLYKHTQMQTTFGVIMLALVNGRPRVLSLKEMLVEFIAHRNVIVVRRTKHDLDAAERKAHILEGFIIALDNIDEVIKIIRGSKDGPTAAAALQARFNLSDAQTKAILDMRLQRLTGLERDKIMEDYRETIKLIEKLKAILASKELQMQIIDDELRVLVEKFGDERRTEIVFDAKDFRVEDMIADEESIITITHNGLIKRTPAATYRRQKRGGRGVTGAGSPDDDFIEHLFHASTHHHLLFFTDKGRIYKVKVYDLPEGSRQAKGRSIANVINKQADEKVTAYLPVKEFVDNRFIVMVTRAGTIKKTALSEFESIRQTGIIAINLTDDDKLIGARITDGESQILLGTRKGLACRFIETDVRPMGRTAQGVRGMSLAPDDYIVGVVIIKRQDTQILVVSENGMGKRTRFEDFRLTHRGGKGVISMNITDKTGSVCGMLSVLDTEDLITITTQGILIRQHIQAIRTIGRNTQGIRLIRLEDGDSIADITVVAHEEDEIEVLDENGEFVPSAELIEETNDLTVENPDIDPEQESLL